MWKSSQQVQPPFHPPQNLFRWGEDLEITQADWKDVSRESKKWRVGDELTNITHGNPTEVSQKTCARYKDICDRNE